MKTIEQIVDEAHRNGFMISNLDRRRGYSQALADVRCIVAEQKQDPPDKCPHDARYCDRDSCCPLHQGIKSTQRAINDRRAGKG
jgi:hypothetical protein